MNLTVYDVMGRVVTSTIKKNQSPGVYAHTFELDNISQGIYFIRFETEEETIVEKVIFLR